MLLLQQVAKHSGKRAVAAVIADKNITRRLGKWLSNKKDKPNITRCHQQGTDVVVLRNRKKFTHNLADIFCGISSKSTGYREELLESSRYRAMLMH